MVPVLPWVSQIPNHLPWGRFSCVRIACILLWDGGEDDLSDNMKNLISSANSPTYW